MKELRSWKKVFESDLDSLCYEIRDLIERPAVILLSGDLGAGKTTFTRHFSRLLNKTKVDFEALSPTYSLINELGNMVHADFYRLEDPSELEALEIPLYLSECDYFFVEWGEKYQNALKDHLTEDFKLYQISIEHPNQESELESQYRNFLLLRLDD